MDAPLSIERLWRSVKYECVYPHGSADVRVMETELGWWFEHYNCRWTHQTTGNRAPAHGYGKVRGTVRAGRKAASGARAA
ncbi:MAG: hypothetical protein EOO38_09295 [Cytophagaceae bacterium]|nr:MAG: hypothetical protein EOO38_09295 [Cytophagaceae bacterium]